MVMNKHSYLSTRLTLVDLNNIKMYTVDKQYKNRRHIALCIAFKKKQLTLQQRGIYTCVSPPGPHHPKSFLLRAGREPGIPAREAGALTRNAKGYSLLHQSLERLF